MLAKIETAMKRPGLVSTDGAPLSLHKPNMWFVLLVIPGRERESADWLKRGHLAIYWPNFVRHESSGQRTKGGTTGRRPRHTSVIPGYLFLADRQEPWNVIYETPHVHGFLRSGTGHAATMSDEDIEIIRRIEGGLNVPPPAKVIHRYKVGDKVRFIDDLLGRWPSGKVTKLADDGRIGVNVALLGRVVLVWAEPHQIEAM